MQIGAWYILCILPPVLGVFFLSHLPLTTDRFGTPWALTCFIADERFRKYAISKQEAVIVGASYASQIPWDAEIGNIAYPAALPREVLHIIRTECSTTKVIFYPVTGFDLYNARFSPTKIISLIYRRTIIGRDVLRTLFRGPMDENLPSINSAEIAELRQAIGKHSDPFGPKEFVTIREQISVLSQPLREEDFEFFRALNQAHPNIIFVLMPIYPINPIRSNGNLSRKIRLLKENHNICHSFFASNSMRFIDITREDDPESFSDMLHLNAEKRIAVAQRLHKHLSAPWR